MNFLFIRNFSRHRFPGIESKRSWIIFVLGALSALSPLSVDMYLPAFPAMAKALATTPGGLSISLSSYFGGLAIGQVCYGPLIDRFGRKRPLYVGLFIYIAASLGCMISSSLGMLVLFRLLSALGGCVATVVAVAMVRDLFAVEESSKIFSLLILVAGLSPLVAPTLGSFLVSSFGWKAVFCGLMLSALGLLVGAFWVLPESFPGDMTLQLLPGSILRAYKEVFLEKQFYVFALVGGIGFSATYAFVAGSPVLFFSFFHVSSFLYGVIFTSLAAGFIGATQINIVMQHYFSSIQLLMFSLVAQLIVSSIFVLLASREMLTIASVIVLLFLTLVNMGFISPNATMLCMAPFRKNAGRASALMSSFQMLFGTLASTGIGFLFGGGVVAIALLFLVIASLAFSLLLLFGRSFLRGEGLVTSSSTTNAGLH